MVLRAVELDRSLLDPTSGGKTEPFLEVIFRPIIKKIKLPQNVSNGFRASIGVSVFFVRAKTVFGDGFGAFLVFGYYLGRDPLMFFR